MNDQKKKSFIDTIRYGLGLYNYTPYVKDHMEEANVRSSMYVALVVIIIEIWMLIRYVLKYVITGMCETFWVFLHYTYRYWIFLFAAIALLIYCFLYLKNKIKGIRKVSRILTTAFAALCLYFGIITSLSDFSRGRMVTCFLTMFMYVTGLLVWKPYAIILMISGVGYYFIYVLNNFAFDKQGNQVVLTEGDLINYITFIISLIMVAISIYFQRYREALEAENLEIAAITDEATGAPNLRRFTQQSIEYQNKTNVNELVYLYFNIENFKTYNDRYGYEQGNKFLTSMGSIINECFPDEPYARESHDHFVVLTKVDGYTQRVEAVKNKILDLYKEENYLDVKVGAYRPNDKNKDPRLEISNASYAASLIKNHENQFIKEYDEKLDKEYRLRQYVLNNIDKAVKEGYIQVYYQPVVWSQDGELCGCEALARWIDPEFGFLSPGTFIPVLEEGRQIHKLDKCIYETVCKRIRESMDNNQPVFPVSLNFSRLDFELMDAVGELDALVEKYQIPRDYLHVEITESAISDDIEKLKACMNSLHEKGYSIWLDDFGSGYSSMNVLKDYDFDLLKVDMVFLKDFSATNQNAKRIIKSILDLASELNMMTLTEGVESQEAVEFLKEAGCGRLQGFYYGKPMLYEEILEKLKDGTFHLSEKLI